MRNSRAIATLVAIIVTFMSSSFAGLADDLVRLTIIHDGRVVSSPDHATIIVDGTGTEVPIVSGAFTVPAAVARADRADFGIELEGERIRIAKLPAVKFGENDWTLLLADSQYEGSYQSDIPWNFKVKRSCILRFDSPEGEPTILVVRNCRSKSK